MSDNFEFDSIFERIKEAKSVVIAGHISPDGDAVGACYGLANAIADTLNITPIVLLENYSDKFKLYDTSAFDYDGEYEALVPDVFLAVDCADKARLGRAAEVFDKAYLTCNIDHHISNTGYAEHNFVNNVSSASEVVYSLIYGLCDITEVTASYLYMGIAFDTGGFKHSSTGTATHEIVSMLVDLVDTSDIHTRLFDSHTLSQARTLQRALNNMQIDGKIAYSAITKAELDEIGTKSGDTDGIAEYLLNIDGIEVSALLTERGTGEDRITKISMRSRRCDVNRVAQSFGGGGHVLAAGAGVKAPIDEVTRLVVDKIKEELYEK
jgi:phosphoesterase RecJ-like protein